VGAPVSSRLNFDNFLVLSGQLVTAVDSRFSYLPPVNHCSGVYRSLPQSTSAVCDALAYCDDFVERVIIGENRL
jgi:hypothetical protein